MHSSPSLQVSRAGLVTRAVGTAVVLVVLAVGVVRDTNDLFPFGSLSQYATARDMNGTIRAVYLTAHTDDEREVRVPLDMDVVGVGRAEIEGQLTRIIGDPSLLQSLAEAYATMHPHRPPLRKLHLMRSLRQLDDGYVVGEPEIEQLATWTVQVEHPS